MLFRIILFILIVTVFFTCQKDELKSEDFVPSQTETYIKKDTLNEVVTPRNGFTDIIFYKTSLTTDNYLLSQNTNYFRTYNLYNKIRIDSITFVSTGKGLLNVGGVLLKHYNISIHYKGKNTPTAFTAFSKSNSERFTYLPNLSTQLLSTSNTAEVMSFEIQKSASTKYNYWIGKPVVLNFVKISKDGVKVDTRVLDPLSKDANIFYLPHTH